MPHPSAERLRYASRLFRAGPTSNKTPSGPIFDGSWGQAAAGFSIYYATHPPKDEESRAAIASEAMKSVFPFLAFEVLAFKNPYFRNESEWRLCVLQAADDWGGASQFRPTNTGIVPYFPVPLKRDDATIQIKEVVVGPRGDQARRIANIKALLAKHQLEGCDVVPSAIPYRGR